MMPAARADPARARAAARIGRGGPGPRRVNGRTLGRERSPALILHGETGRERPVTGFWQASEGGQISQREHAQIDLPALH